MSRVFVFVGVLLLALGHSATGQDKPKDLQWTHAFDLASRKVGEVEFSPSTQRYGVEALRDLNTGLGIYVSEKGSIAFAPGFKELELPLSVKAPIWIAGLDLPARKAGENSFDKATLYPLEIFRDPNTDDLVFVTAAGLVAASPAKGKVAGGTAAPVWVHSVDLNVRKGGVTEWKDAGKIGVEVWRDPNTGHLVYVSQSGQIAVVPDNSAAKTDKKDPSWLHGLDLFVRKADEPRFTNKTRPFGVEVFRDETNGNLIYIAETGSLAVIPGGESLKAPTVDVKKPGWTHGWNVKARKYGEKDFNDRTQVYGGEVFRDENTGVLIAVSEAGAISATRPLTK